MKHSDQFGGRNYFYFEILATHENHYNVQYEEADMDASREDASYKKSHRWMKRVSGEHVIEKLKDAMQEVGHFLMQSGPKKQEMEWVQSTFNRIKNATFEKINQYMMPGTLKT